jgi:hypothetical protein
MELDGLKMTTTDKLLAKATEGRVKDIQIGELYDIFPKAKEIELKLFKKLIRNEQKLSDKDKYINIGSLVEIMIYRIMEEEES